VSVNVKNILLELEYVGSSYFGFQIQEKGGKNQTTVQGVLEETLAKLFREKIRIVASGRTDRGVHAKAQVVNFKVDTKIPLEKIKPALNKLLPSDVRVKKVKKVSGDFHARFSVKSKIYRYLILNTKKPSVFWHNLAWYVDGDLDIDLMEKASRKIKGKRDFSVFAKKAKKDKDCIRDIKVISIKKKSSFIYIDIEANGFLRFMARNIVSFLVKLSKGSTPLKDISLILRGRIPYINKPAPPGGLYLYKVIY